MRFNNKDKAMGLWVLTGIFGTYAIWAGTEGMENFALICYIAALYCLVHSARMWSRPPK